MSEILIKCSTDSADISLNHFSQMSVIQTSLTRAKAFAHRFSCLILAWITLVTLVGGQFLPISGQNGELKVAEHSSLPDGELPATEGDPEGCESGSGADAQASLCRTATPFQNKLTLRGRTTLSADRLPPDPSAQVLTPPPDLQVA